jgi:hypothetical protein
MAAEEKKNPLAGRKVKADTPEPDQSFLVARDMPPLVAAPGFPPVEKGIKTFVTAIRSPANPHWHGVYSLDVIGPGKRKVEQICETPFKVNALVVDIDSGEQALEISFMPAGSTAWVDQVWDKASLVTGKIDSHCWRKLVLSGLSVSARQLPRLHEFIRFASDYLAQIGEIPKKDGTCRTGWVADEYVAAGWRTPNAPLFIGGRLDASSGAWEQAGDETAYMQTMRMLTAHNPLFEFVAGYFLSGFLLSRLGGAENFTLCLLGDSTLGKTLAAKMCVAMKGRPGAFATFDSTAGALKNLMAQSNDGCMVIDEVGTSTMSDDAKAKFLYDVSSGKERARLQRDGNGFSASETKPCRYSVLITGEESLLVKPSADGQRVRYTEIVFNRENRLLWKSILSGRQADDYMVFFESNHGWLVPQAIKHIRKNVDRYRKVYADALAALHEHEPNHKAQRKHKLFAASVAGVALLNDSLGKKFDFQDAIATVLDLASGSGREMEEAGTPDEQFLSALTGTSARLGAHLFHKEEGVLVDGPSKEPNIGEYGTEKGMAGEEPVHTFKLDKSAAQWWADKSGVDLARFLDWAEREQYLRVFQPKGRNKPRRDSFQTIGPAKAYAYKFVFKMGEE